MHIIITRSSEILPLRHLSDFYRGTVYAVGGEGEAVPLHLDTSGRRRGRGGMPRHKEREVTPRPTGLGVRPLGGIVGGKPSCEGEGTTSGG